LRVGERLGVLLQSFDAEEFGADRLIAGEDIGVRRFAANAISEIHG
jgi:hypothetical protein